jgi:hypothetical protein
VFTPKDFGLTEIMARIVAAIREAHALPPLEVRSTLSPGAPLPR